MNFIRIQVARIQKINLRFETNTIISILVTLLSRGSATQISILRELFLKCLSWLASVKKNDNLTFFVGLRLFTNSRQSRANNLFKEVKDLSKLTPRALHFIARCASWVSDPYNLERIRKQLGPDSSIGLFADALINHTLNPKLSIASFGLVERVFLSEQKSHARIPPYPEYVKVSINVLDLGNIHEVDLGDLQSATLMDEQMQFSNTPSHDMPKLIIISFTLPFLLEFAEIVAKRVRALHDHPILFIVIVSNDSDVQKASSTLKFLLRNIPDIYWQIYISSFDTPNISSVARFFAAQNYFENYNCQSIMILDADTSFVKSDPIKIWDKIGDDFAIGFIAHENLSPWERLSLGWTIMNRNEFTKNFLRDFRIYVTYQFSQGRAFWTLDQTAAYFVLMRLLVSSEETMRDSAKILDLSAYISLKNLIFLDRTMRKRKMRAKQSNENFILELNERLFFD